MEKNYCATIRRCEQVSPDDWDTITRTLEVKENTTMKEIADWYRKNSPTRERVYVLISELEKPQP
jgi:hypothetical protein